MKNPRIVIVDSGISPSSTVGYRVVESYKAVENGKSGWDLIKIACEDFVGHGTAVANIMYDVNPNIDIINIQICQNDLIVDEAGLIYVLNFINQNLDIDLVNISAGITYLTEFKMLDEICQTLISKGVYIVSAFDNDGAISFPAAVDSVIGVDVEKDYENKNDVILVENGIVNFLVADRYYRTEWLNKKTIIKGTSFACAYITGLISLVIKNDFFSPEKISNKKYSFPIKQEISKPEFKIKKAIMFPCNKEVHSLLRFRGELGFEIIGVYDERLSGKVGQEMFGIKIESYDCINWEDESFDTIIFSCSSELSKLTKKNYKNEILDNAKVFKKNIYSFENLGESSGTIFYPCLKPEFAARGNNLKLYKPIIPVVGIFGTSSKQGKYTLLKKIIKELSSYGYDVGEIATEPSGYLFDSDFVFHFGYGSEIKLQPWEFISILNEMSWKVQLNARDILVTSCQSGISHYNNSNINEFGILQHLFFLGTLPDVMILCVNPHDDFDYIQKSINFLNSIDEGKVIALSVFPVKAVATMSGIGYKTTEIGEKEMMEIKESMTKEFNIPVFSMNENAKELCSIIINEFSSTEES